MRPTVHPYRGIRRNLCRIRGGLTVASSLILSAKLDKVVSTNGQPLFVVLGTSSLVSGTTSYNASGLKVGTNKTKAIFRGRRLRTKAGAGTQLIEAHTAGP